jgi:Family of unknown function (DUF6978)
MSDLVLTQVEADALIAMSKYRVDDQQWEYPGLGGKVSVPLVGENKRESFLLDVSRGRIDFLKGTYQNRARQTMILVRIDFGGAPHRNPDGEEMPSPHLHVYREGYGDKWAVPIPPENFPSLQNHWETLHDFMKYCNIGQPPIFLRGLFT